MAGQAAREASWSLGLAVAAGTWQVPPLLRAASSDQFQTRGHWHIARAGAADAVGSVQLAPANGNGGEGPPPDFESCARGGEAVGDWVAQAFSSLAGRREFFLFLAQIQHIFQI